MLVFMLCCAPGTNTRQHLRLVGVGVDGGKLHVVVANHLKRYVAGPRVTDGN
jgi:hypothetical protein